MLVKQGEQAIILNCDLSILGDLLHVYDSSREAVAAFRDKQHGAA